MSTRLAFFAMLPVTALLTLFAAAAVWIDGPSDRRLAGLLVAAFLAGVIGPLVRIRPLWRGCSWGLVPCLAVLGWWASAA